ncbi:MAG TPA: cytochrome c [Terriglobales bacterium]|nr:cytochrome c [Terriglobales bacterium]
MKAIGLLFMFAFSLLLGACSQKGDATRGKRLFDSTCDVCHYANSTKARAGPGFAGLYKQRALLDGTPVNDKNVERWIRQGSRLMPGYRNAITPEEMRDLLAYLKTL